jgi:hypothetical protein
MKIHITTKTYTDPYIMVRRELPYHKAPHRSKQWVTKQIKLTEQISQLRQVLQAPRDVWKENFDKDLQEAFQVVVGMIISPSTT